MASYEEHEKGSGQSWYSRSARERQDLSASVEATLADQHEAYEEIEDNERGQAQVAARKGAVIPPRLSLQSRPMPIVHVKAPGAPSADGKTDGHMVVSATWDEHEHPAKPRSTGVLARFAQRFTSSLAALGGTKPLATQDSGQVQAVPATQTSYVQDTGQQEKLPSNFTNTLNADSAMLQAVASTMADKEIGSEQSVDNKVTDNRVKVAGRPAKVRLETTEHRALTQPVVSDISAMRTIHDGSGLAVTSDMQALDLISFGDMEEVRIEERADAPAREMLGGCGVIETGQSELLVANKHITEKSLVLVMLTSDPGPVVVHYITLQPAEGFTMHLTAPVNKKTSFNYIILLGELF